LLFSVVSVEILSFKGTEV